MPDVLPFPQFGQWRPVEKLDDFMSSPVIFLLLIDAPSDV
jgi:hypothetical protein